jgi:ComF family protein
MTEGSLGVSPVGADRRISAGANQRLGGFATAGFSPAHVVSSKKAAASSAAGSFLVGAWVFFPQRLSVTSGAGFTFGGGGLEHVAMPMLTILIHIPKTFRIRIGILLTLFSPTTNIWRATFGCTYPITLSMGDTFAFRNWLCSLLDWVVPPRCGSCGNHACAPFCSLCQQSLVASRPADLHLPAFAHNGKLADSIYAPYLYGGELASAIARLKYAKLSYVATPLESLLAAERKECYGAVELVIPVPLHVRRLKSRGFNQSALIAAPFARRLRRKFDCNALWRVEDTPSQTRLNVRQRHENMVGAFTARPEFVNGKNVLLLDDVMTTGATMASCCRALREAGAAKVHLLALSVTPP